MYVVSSDVCYSRAKMVSKKVNVLSGGERVRVMLSKMMILASNVLIIDEPTAHLEMEFLIAALNRWIDQIPGSNSLYISGSSVYSDNCKSYYGNHTGWIDRQDFNIR